MSGEGSLSGQGGPIVLWARSPAWIKSIRRLELPGPLVAALDLDDLEDELLRTWGSVGLVELKALEVPATCHWAAQLQNHPQQPRLYALGSPDLVGWSPLVRAAGFVQAYWSISQAASLGRSIHRHVTTASWPERDLETVIESQLPWARRGPAAHPPNLSEDGAHNE